MTKRSHMCSKKASMFFLLFQLTIVGDGFAGGNMLAPLLKWNDSGAVQMSDVAMKYSEIIENMDVNWLDFSPDGKYIAASSLSDSNEVHVWEWESKRLVHNLYKQRGGADPTVTEGLKYSPDGRFLAACHGRAEKHIVSRIWDAKTGNIVHDIAESEMGQCSAIAFAADSQLVYRVNGFAITANNIIAYSTKTWQTEWGLRTVPFYPVTLAISPDGRLAAFGGVDAGTAIPDQPRILIVDLQKHAVVRTIKAFPESYRIDRIAWSPDSAHIASSTLVGSTPSGKDIVKIFDALTGDPVTAVAVKTAEHIWALRYSPDGKYLVEAPIQNKIRVWDRQHKALLQEIPVEEGVITIAFSHDGRFLAVSMGGKKIDIWKMK